MMNEDRLIFIKMETKNLISIMQYLDTMIMNNNFVLNDLQNLPPYIFKGPKYQKEYFNFLKTNSKKYGFFANDVCHLVDKDRLYKYIKKNIKKLDSLISKTTVSQSVYDSAMTTKDVFDRLTSFLDQLKKSIYLGCIRVKSSLNGLKSPFKHSSIDE